MLQHLVGQVHIRVPGPQWHGLRVTDVRQPGQVEHHIGDGAFIDSRRIDSHECWVKTVYAKTRAMQNPINAPDPRPESDETPR